MCRQKSYTASLFAESEIVCYLAYNRVYTFIGSFWFFIT